MAKVAELLRKNRLWSEEIQRTTPDFFPSLARQQAPDFLWIGCADSRVPANQIVDVAPGEMFVHRNIANVVVPGDANALAVLQYAVDVLQVEHVIVCGHYGCGGVRAALDETPLLGPLDRWLSHMRELKHRHQPELDAMGDDAARWDRLCELNVQRGVEQVAATEIVQKAWERGQPLAVHGWIYALSDGLLNDLGPSRRGPGDATA